MTTALKIKKTFADLVSHRPQVSKKNYAGAYWGSQSISAFPPRLTELAKQHGAFIDLTAGGAGYPFHLAEAGVDVHVNDRNFYAIASHRTVFNKEGVRLHVQDRDMWFEELCESTYPKHIKPRKGFATKHVGTDKFTINKELASYIDGLLLSFPQPLMRSIVGRTLVKNCTFRAYWWCTKQANGKPMDEYSAEQFWVSAMRCAWSLRLFAERIAKTDTLATEGDALAAIDKIREPAKTIVYTDPAWPWALSFGAQKNPYEFFTNQIGSILMQKPISVDDINFWSNKDDERTVRDVTAWITKAFERGCPYFCLSTQSTNAPEPESMYEQLAKEFKQVWYEKNPARSYNANKTFHEYFVTYEPR